MLQPLGWKGRDEHSTGEPRPHAGQHSEDELGRSPGVDRDDAVVGRLIEEPRRERPTGALELLVRPCATGVDDRSRSRPLTAHGEDPIGDRRRGRRPGHSIFEARTEIAWRGLGSNPAIERRARVHEVVGPSNATLGRFRKRGCRVFSIETTPREACFAFVRTPTDAAFQDGKPTGAAHRPPPLEEQLRDATRRAPCDDRARSAFPVEVRRPLE